MNKARENTYNCIDGKSPQKHIVQLTCVHWVFTTTTKKPYYYGNHFYLIVHWVYGRVGMITINWLITRFSPCRILPLLGSLGVKGHMHKPYYNGPWSLNIWITEVHTTLGSILYKPKLMWSCHISHYMKCCYAHKTQSTYQISHCPFINTFYSVRHQWNFHNLLKSKSMWPLTPKTSTKDIWVQAVAIRTNQSWLSIS